MSKEIKLLTTVYEKLSFSLAAMQNTSHQEISANKGVSKVRVLYILKTLHKSNEFSISFKAQVIIKDVAIFSTVMLDVQLPLIEYSRLVRKIICDFLKATDWLEADSFLMNCFLKFLLKSISMDIGHSCCTQNYEGKPLIKAICMRTQALSLKSPHTDTSLALIRNGIAVMIKSSQFVDVRQILKSIRVMKVFETFQVHLDGKKKVPWDDITILWLQLLEYLSTFEDTECVSK